jgi:hypothetical protein
VPAPAVDDIPIARADGHSWCDLGQEIVVLHARDGRYYRLDGTGRALWLLLDRPSTMADLVSRLMTEFAGDPEVVIADTRSFVNQCAELGLLAVQRARH